MDDQNDIIVGIDLGTTFSLVAWADQRGPQVVRDERGDGRVPSVLALVPGAAGEPYRVEIGWIARDHAIENARTTVYSVKRLIGKGLADIERELPYLSYAVVPGPRESLQVRVGEQTYTPEQISAAILTELRQRASRHLGRPVRRAVITVPAYFDDAQRQATRAAGQAAGLEVVRMINEPTAAALAYGIGVRALAQGAGAGAERRMGHVPLPLPHCTDQPIAETTATPDEAGELVAVYDLGGGTFDVSILRIEAGVFQVLSTAGDTHLGGDDFDQRLIALLAGEIAEQFGVRIESPPTKQALRTLAESLKIRLSEQERADCELDLGSGRTYRRSFARSEFERLTADLVERTIGLVEQALRDARLTSAQLAQFVLVGGSTRMPAVRRRVAQFLGRAPYTALNPDEVVAIGAAIQGAILSGAARDMLLLDVTPLSLGIETMGGAMGKLILRNTTIPCRATEMFTTFVDGQTAIKLSVLQGERELAADCRRLAEFELRDLPPMPAGIPKVEVEFLIDANGILNVAAREQRSGKQASIQVVPHHGLTREEVAKITRDSLDHARADIEAHRRIDLCNQVAFDTNKAEQMLAKVGNQLDARERERIVADIAALRRLAAETADLDALHRALDAFGKSTLRLAEIGIREALKTGR